MTAAVFTVCIITHTFRIPLKWEPGCPASQRSDILWAQGAVDRAQLIATVFDGSERAMPWICRLYCRHVQLGHCPNKKTFILFQTTTLKLQNIKFSQRGICQANVSNECIWAKLSDQSCRAILRTKSFLLNDQRSTHQCRIPSKCQVGNSYVAHHVVQVANDSGRRTYRQ